MSDVSDAYEAQSEEIPDDLDWEIPEAPEGYHTYEGGDPDDPEGVEK